jgi:hypothetical protein
VLAGGGCIADPMIDQLLQLLLPTWQIFGASFTNFAPATFKKFKYPRQWQLAPQISFFLFKHLHWTLGGQTLHPSSLELERFRSSSERHAPAAADYIDALIAVECKGWGIKTF